MNLTRQDYVKSALDPFLDEVYSVLLSKKPEKPVPFLLSWLENKMGISGRLSEKEELHELRKQVAHIKLHDEYGSEEEKSRSESEDDSIDELPVKIAIQPSRHRSAVSAESYGEWNQQINLALRMTPKTPQQERHLIDRLSTSFMFSSLQDGEKRIVIQAIEEKKYNAGEIVIKEGEDGNELFIVETGSLNCFKSIDGEDKLIKKYLPGDIFGELALLFNAPRAASIVTSEESILWSLNRECFNQIAKEAATKRRNKYNELFSRIEILEGMDPYERYQLADVLRNVSYDAGDYVIRQGEEGNQFFIIEEGSAVATMVLKEGQEAEEVMKYSEGSYFGELALIKNELRAANIIAVTPLKCLVLDRHSFKRLLGPLEQILKRKAKDYEEVIAKRNSLT